MSNLPGKNYIVVSGDTLTSIAQKAYGDATKWPIIWNANQTSMKSDDPDIVFPGDSLFIPLEPVAEIARIKSIKAAMANRSNEELTIVIGGVSQTILKPLSARITKNMQNGMFAWSANIQWNPGENPGLDEDLLPFKYPRASIFIGKTLLINGFLYSSNPSLTIKGRIKTLFGYSPMADVEDSTLMPPYEINNVTLVDRIKSVLLPFGMDLEIKSGLDTGGAFKRVSVSVTEKAFRHLSLLASQRGVLLTSTPEGAALLTQANIEGKPVGTIREGEHLAQEFTGEFNGRRVFSIYKSIGKSPGQHAKTAISKNVNIPRSRFYTFVANDTISGEMQKLTDWKRSKQFAEGMKNTIPVKGWYAPNRELWQENTNVILFSKTLSLPNGFPFLIQSVEFILDLSGIRTNLTLVPPEVYTGGDIGYPWSN
jgi:prophage tail gpP-like protein